MADDYGVSDATAKGILTAISKKVEPGRETALLKRIGFCVSFARNSRAVQAWPKPNSATLRSYKAVIDDLQTTLACLPRNQVQEAESVISYLEGRLTGYANLHSSVNKPGRKPLCPRFIHIGLFLCEALEDNGILPQGNVSRSDPSKFGAFAAIFQLVLDEAGIKSPKVNPDNCTAVLDAWAFENESEDYIYYRKPDPTGSFLVDKKRKKPSR